MWIILSYCWIPLHTAETLFMILYNIQGYNIVLPNKKITFKVWGALKKVFVLHTFLTMFMSRIFSCLTLSKWSDSSRHKQRQGFENGILFFSSWLWKKSQLSSDLGSKLMFILCKEVFLAPDLESTEQDKPHINYCFIGEFWHFPILEQEFTNARRQLSDYIPCNLWSFISVVQKRVAERSAMFKGNSVSSFSTVYAWLPVHAQTMCAFMSTEYIVLNILLKHVTKKKGIKRFFLHTLHIVKI